MNKSELIKTLAEQSNLSLDESTMVVNTFVDSMKKALLEGDRVEIRGFGSFKIKEYESYAGRNPRTGARAAGAGTPFRHGCTKRRRTGRRRVGSSRSASASLSGERARKRLPRAPSRPSAAARKGLIPCSASSAPRRRGEGEERPEPGVRHGGLQTAASNRGGPPWHDSGFSIRRAASRVSLCATSPHRT